MNEHSVSKRYLCNRDYLFNENGNKNSLLICFVITPKWKVRKKQEGRNGNCYFSYKCNWTFKFNQFNSLIIIIQWLWIVSIYQLSIRILNCIFCLFIQFHTVCVHRGERLFVCTMETYLFSYKNKRKKERNTFQRWCSFFKMVDQLITCSFAYCTYLLFAHVHVLKYTRMTSERSNKSSPHPKCIKLEIIILIINPSRLNSL